MALVVGASLVAACGGAAATSTNAPATANAATLPPATANAATLPPATTNAATPASTSTRTATPSAVASSTASGGAALVADGKTLFFTTGPSGKGCAECHGQDGRGSTATDGTTSPNIRGTTEVKLRNALAGGASLMTNLKLTDRQIEAVLAYLVYLDQQ